eukprot:692496-Karenia_brevis.AAC.1
MPNSPPADTVETPRGPYQVAGPVPPNHPPPGHSSNSTTRERTPRSAERRQRRAPAERENLRYDDRRPRNRWVRQKMDHYTPTGDAWKDFDPVEDMTDADLDNIFDERSDHQHWIHRNFTTYVAGNPLERKNAE